MAIYDGNLNWVKVTVQTPAEIDRVHAALARGLGRPKLRPPVGDVIVVEWFDRHATEGLVDVDRVIAEDFGSDASIETEVGFGNVEHMYGPYPS